MSFKNTVKAYSLSILMTLDVTFILANEDEGHIECHYHT